MTAIASDGRGGMASQTFSINVSAAQANRAPTAQDDQYAVRRGDTLTVRRAGRFAKRFGPGWTEPHVRIGEQPDQRAF